MFIKSNQGGVMSARNAYPTRMRFATKFDRRMKSEFRLSSRRHSLELVTCSPAEAKNNLSSGRSGTLYLCRRERLSSCGMRIHTEGRGRLVVEVEEVVDWGVVRSFIPAERRSSAMVSCEHVCSHARYTKFVITW